MNTLKEEKFLSNSYNMQTLIDFLLIMSYVIKQFVRLIDVVRPQHNSLSFWIVVVPYFLGSL